MQNSNRSERIVALAKSKLKPKTKLQMKTNKSNLRLAFIALTVLTFAGIHSAVAQGTAFTYQGRLTSGTNVANGNYDLQFYLRDALMAGNPVGNTNTLAPVAVSNGLFTVALDFGAGIFTGPARWLEIGVRTNGSLGPYSTLSPRQPVTPSPYAITAENLVSGGLAGPYTNAVALNNPANSFTGNGGGLTNVNAANLGGLSASSFWKLAGNAATTPGANFLGTTDPQALELKVNGARALRLEPDAASPNVVGGASVNSASGATGATIGGGGTLNFSGMAFANVVSGLYGTVSGGLGNGSSGFASGIGSGFGNLIEGQANYSVIAGGSGNWVQIGAQSSGIGAGNGNTIGTNANYGTIAGGQNNLIQVGVTYASIGGGTFNTIQTDAPYSTIGGGSYNTIQTNSEDSTIGGGGANMIQASATFSTIGGGGQNRILDSAFESTIGGGYVNTIQTNSSESTIGGGYNNIIQPNAGFSTIGGGFYNIIQTNANDSTIGGGNQNTSSGQYATVGGGYHNTSSGSSATIGGGSGNTNLALEGTIAGGGGNQIGVWGGQSIASTIGGGEYNKILGFDQDASTIGGGSFNTIQAGSDYETIGGGSGNTILGGAFGATISGGGGNTNAGEFATVPGGLANYAGGNYSFAAGRRAKATNDGCFVFADSTDADFGSSFANEFLIRASFVGIGRASRVTPAEYFGVEAPVGAGAFGGMYVDTTAATGRPFYGYAQAGVATAYHYVDGFDGNKWKLNVSGGDRITVTTGGNVGIGNTTLTDKLMVGNAHCDGTTWINASDRNLKTGFAPIEPRTVLERVAALPIQQWSYKDSAHVTHLGPVAQDFKAAFGLGADDTSIATVDESGVALAAIQGLNQKLEDQRAENADLKQEVADLKKLMNQLNQRLNGGVK
jgi:trimeric autotransporter adhesin